MVRKRGSKWHKAGYNFGKGKIPGRGDKIVWSLVNTFS
jgi:ribosomal protein L27